MGVGDKEGNWSLGLIMIMSNHNSYSLEDQEKGAANVREVYLSV